MEENLNQQKQSVPAPPAPDITIRTMESDVKSIEQSGGELVTPQPFSHKIVKDEELKAEVELDVPGYTGPEKATFASSPTIAPEQLPAKKSINWKIIGIVLGILIIVSIFWLLGYFIIFPWFFPKQMPAV